MTSEPGAPFLYSATSAGLPAFFETPVGPLLVLIFLMGLATITSLAAHRHWMRESTLMAWVAVVLIGGPLGVVLWFTVGRAAVRRHGEFGEDLSPDMV